MFTIDVVTLRNNVAPVAAARTAGRAIGWSIVRRDLVASSAKLVSFIS